MEREALTAVVDQTQHTFSCCGVVSPSDYQNSVDSNWRWKEGGRLEVPKTCCTLLNKGVNLGVQTEEKENFCTID